jgi:hypothetical protein
MEAEECRAYILHRLRAVGWNHDPQLAPEIFTGIHHASRGIPRKINLIMDRLLLYGYLEELHSLDQAALTTVLGEIREEMPDMPLTLEAPTAGTRGREPARAAVTSERESELAALELKRNNILLQLMREEVRLKEILEGGMSQASATGDELVADSQRLYSAREGK